MQRCRYRRVFSTPSAGFTLIELLLTMALIGIIAALLMPSIMQARQEALRQTVRQQAKVMEAALAQWFNAQPSLVTASSRWDTFAVLTGPNARRYITNANFIAQELSPYLPDANKTIFNISATGAVSTPQMQMVTASAAGSFIGGSLPGINDNLTSANLVLSWDPTRRVNSSPRVEIFLPDIPTNP